MNHQQLAIGFFIGLACVPVLLFLRAQRKTDYSIIEYPLFLVAMLLVRLLWRAQVPPLPIPSNQGAVLVCNHRSSVDPFFIQIVSDRVIHWMVAREFCEHPAFRWFLMRSGAIPVNRGGIDTAATKMAIRLVGQGGLVGMFPEGRINMTERFMLAGRHGAILVAIKGRVPILPCYIQGAPYDGTTPSPFFMSARVRVHFGTPIDMSAFYDRADDAQSLGSIMLEVMSRIAELAGQEDFQPELAGRRWKPSREEIQRDTEASRNRREVP